jgi:hypothetical protein
MCNVCLESKYSSNFGQAIMLHGCKYALERKVGQKTSNSNSFPISESKYLI